MSDRSVLSFNGKPHWNFTATAAYPIVLPQGNKKPVVHVYLSPYEPAELKELLKKAVSGYKRDKSDVEIVKEDSAIYTPLCDRHFIKLGNATGTPDQQLEWLNRRPEIKPGIVEHTFGGLQMETANDDSSADSILDISMELSGQIKVHQELFDEESDKVVKVEMFHNYAHPTEQQYREYRSARRSKFIRKSTLWTITEQHSTLEKLYDSVIRSIDGAAANGSPCKESEKAQWLGSVPLWHKLWIVDQIFSEIVEKNG